MSVKRATRRAAGGRDNPMHECEYCGEVRCTKRACLDALLANAAYYDAEIKLRAAVAEADKATFQAKDNEAKARGWAAKMKEQLREKAQPR